MKRALLTPVQVRVLAAVEDGVSLTRAAGRLGRSRTYVASRLSEIYKRLELAERPPKDRRAAAVRLAREAGLLPPGEMT